ncbi:UNVERIFIED_CONTAM: hypothetical protein FKN15_043589, partial [Acipenser sinensis]
ACSPAGSPPATGTGTLVITLEDGNDHAPSLYPSVARVCEDSKDLSVVLLGGRDEDISPNADPFKFELGKQAGLEKTWKITKVNNTHAQVSLLHNLKRANYNLPIIVTDSGMPPLSNSTEIKVQVCTCKKNKMDCSAADSLHMSLAMLICFSFITLLYTVLLFPVVEFQQMSYYTVLDWAVRTSEGRSFHHCGARVEKERALEAGERRGGRASLLVQAERRGRVGV